MNTVHLSEALFGDGTVMEISREKNSEILPPVPCLCINEHKIR